MPTWWATLSFQHLESKKIVVFLDGMMGIFCQGNNEKIAIQVPELASSWPAVAIATNPTYNYDYHVVVIQLFTIIGCEKPWCEKWRVMMFFVACCWLLCWKLISEGSASYPQIVSDWSSLGRSKCPYRIQSPPSHKFFLAHGSCVCDFSNMTRNSCCSVCFSCLPKEASALNLAERLDTRVELSNTRFQWESMFPKVGIPNLERLSRWCRQVNKSFATHPRHLSIMVA